MQPRVSPSKDWRWDADPYFVRDGGLCQSAWQPNPGRRSTYRCGKSVQTTGATSQWTLNAAMMQHVGQPSYPKLRGCPYGQDPESIGATQVRAARVFGQSLRAREGECELGTLAIGKRCQFRDWHRAVCRWAGRRKYRRTRHAPR